MKSEKKKKRLHGQGTEWINEKIITQSEVKCERLS